MVEGDPGEKAGLKPGDTITKFNETVIKSVKQFRKQMDTAKPGDKVRLGVRRGIDRPNAHRNPREEVHCFGERAATVAPARRFLPLERIPTLKKQIPS